MSARTRRRRHLCSHRRVLGHHANGYLAAITNSSDTLTGSIVINGKTVDVPSSSGSDTLSGLASAINSASIGVTASVTTDANGSA